MCWTWNWLSLLFRGRGRPTPQSGHVVALKVKIELIEGDGTMDTNPLKHRQKESVEVKVLANITDLDFLDEIERQVFSGAGAISDLRSEIVNGFGIAHKHKPGFAVPLSTVIGILRPGTQVTVRQKLVQGEESLYLAENISTNKKKQ